MTVTSTSDSDRRGLRVCMAGGVHRCELRERIKGAISGARLVGFGKMTPYQNEIGVRILL